MAREAGKRKARKPLQTLRKWRAKPASIVRTVSGVRLACSAYTSLPAARGLELQIACAFDIPAPGWEFPGRQRAFGNFLRAFCFSAYQQRAGLVIAVLHILKAHTATIHRLAELR